MKRWGIILVLACVHLSGCGGAGNTASGDANKNAMPAAAPAAGDGFNYDVAPEDEEAAPEEYTEEVQDAGDNGESTKGAGNTGDRQTGENSTNKIDDEKLVYTCTMSLDTLEYENSVKSFRALIKKYEGFVESENESDDAGVNGFYYYDETKEGKKHYTYTARVRIPSAKYNDFVDETGSIGDVRSRNANVENVSRAYYDLQAELEILETKYKRYLEMLNKAETTEDIITIENTITSIETQINQIKTQLNRYDNDVAYSYVNVTIRGVEKIVKEEEQGTVGNAFSESWESFLDVCHGLLVLFIVCLPYLIVIAVIVVIVILATIPARRRRKAARAAFMEQQNKTELEENNEQ